jgi:F0F1-type ATP synthase alpha subunit
LETGLTYNVIDSIPTVYEVDSFIAELFIFLLSGLAATVINVIVECIMLSLLGSDFASNVGDVIYRTYIELVMEVGFNLLGRVISPTCEYLDY